MKKTWGKSLRSRIFFSFTFFVVIPLIVAMGVIWIKTNQEMESRQTQVYEENTLYLSRLSSSLFDEIKSKSLLIYYDEKTMDILKKMEPPSEDEQKLLNGKASAIFYSDDDIESVAFYIEKASLMVYRKRNQTSRFYKVENEQEAESYFINSIDPKEVRYQISTVYNDELGEYQVVLDQNIMDSYNRPVMKIEIVYNKKLFEPIFSKQPDQSSKNFILDDRGQFLYAEFGDGFPEDLQSIIRSAPEGISRAVQGEEYVIIKKRLEKFPYDMVKCISRKELLNHALLYRNSIAAIFCIVVGIIALLALVLSRLVSQPIRKFTQSITSFRKSGQNTVERIQPDIKEMDELAESFYGMMLEINQLIEEKSEARYREKKAQLNMLTVQINPHFLYNALQTLQFMALKRKAFEINAMLLSLGKILRYSLDWNTEEVTLGEELENALEYLNIQKFRYVDELNLQVEKPEQLPDFKVPKMLLQPLVENCFVHGFKGKTENYKVKLSIECREDVIAIKVCDNGKGMDAEAMEALNMELKKADSYLSSDHTGLLSLNFRLRQKYPQASVHIEQGEWFCIEMNIPGGYDEGFDNR